MTAPSSGIRELDSETFRFLQIANKNKLQVRTVIYNSDIEIKIMPEGTILIYNKVLLDKGFFFFFTWSQVKPLTFNNINIVFGLTIDKIKYDKYLNFIFF